MCNKYCPKKCQSQNVSLSVDRFYLVFWRVICIQIKIWKLCICLKLGMIFLPQPREFQHLFFQKISILSLRFDYIRIYYTFLLIYDFTMYFKYFQTYKFEILEGVVRKSYPTSNIFFFAIFNLDTKYSGFVRFKYIVLRTNKLNINRSRESDKVWLLFFFRPYLLHTI